MEDVVEVLKDLSITLVRKIKSATRKNTASKQKPQRRRPSRSRPTAEGMLVAGKEEGGSREPNQPNRKTVQED